jgi:hypothetical protein
MWGESRRFGKIRDLRETRCLRSSCDEDFVGVFVICSKFEWNGVSEAGVLD